MNQKTGEVTLSASDYDAVIFDMDGVVTQTAGVHKEAWKRLFDAFREQSGGTWKPFDPDTDYSRYVDGKPRIQGIRSFLKSRGVEPPLGDPGDGLSHETLRGLGNRKNEIFHDLIESRGVDVYESGVNLLKSLKDMGIKAAVVTSSKNCEQVLRATNLLHSFDARVGGVEAESLGLRGKPDPDIFLEATRLLQVKPGRTAVLEDSPAGVEAGTKGHFGLVVGVDRSGHAGELKEKGAHVVVDDLSRIRVHGNRLPHALENRDEILSRLEAKEAVVFLDYDGTLTPIVDSPEKATLSKDMRSAVQELSGTCTVAVISGRDLKDVREKVGIQGIYYAGSHGFDISGPGGRREELQKGREFLPVLDEAEKSLKPELDHIPGVLLERKRFSIAVHYRKVDPEEVDRVEALVDRALEESPGLKKSSGKKIFELQPGIDWDKGKALLFVLEALGFEGSDVCPVYIGDDTTDEDAFRAIRESGVGVVVTDEKRLTDARYFLRSPDEVKAFLKALTSIQPD